MEPLLPSIISKYCEYIIETVSRKLKKNILSNENYSLQVSESVYSQDDFISLNIKKIQFSRQVFNSLVELCLQHPSSPLIGLGPIKFFLNIFRSITR